MAAWGGNWDTDPAEDADDELAPAVVHPDSRARTDQDRTE